MRKYIAEFIGTFGLVFFGTGAIIVNEQTGGALGHVGIAITSGLVVLSMIYAFGEISGAHINPAVTLGFAVANRLDKKEVLPYIIAQIAGAFAATLILHVLFPANINLGTTLPAGSAIQSFIIEIILTYFLMMVIFNVSQGSKEVGVLAGIAIGSTILLEAMSIGPISGGSMNPARSLAPAIVSGNMSMLWIYLIAPFIGSGCAALTWLAMRPNPKSSF